MTFYSKTIGAEVTEAEAREEIRQCHLSANDRREWPHHQKYARERAAAIARELEAAA